MRKFAAFDIDGTLIRWQLYHATADAFARFGYVDKAAHQAIKEARLRWKRRENAISFKDYETSVIKLYELALKKIKPEQVEAAISAVFDEYKDQVYTYTRDLIADLKTSGYFLLAISGSQTEIVAKIAEYYGFDDYVGTIYQHKNGAYTGKVEVGSAHKDQVLKMMVEKHNLDWKDSIAIGDSHSDLAMLKLVERPIAFNPELELYKQARASGWKIVIERKNSVYELEDRDGTYILA
jgi:HAD superfamily hydrolase (TIGR01490 family)